LARKNVGGNTTLFENLSYHSSNNFLFCNNSFFSIISLANKHDSQNLPKVQATVNIGGITHVAHIVFKSVSHDNLCEDEYNNSIRSQLFYGCISGTIAWLLFITLLGKPNVSCHVLHS
jgi:hypothetical protein